jgi:hypothetical protein
LRCRLNIQQERAHQTDDESQGDLVRGAGHINHPGFGVILTRYVAEKQMNSEELGHESGGATHALFAWRLQEDLSAGQDAPLDKKKKKGREFVALPAAPPLWALAFSVLSHEF